MPLINPNKNPELVFTGDGMPDQFTNPDLAYEGPAPYERPIKLDGNDLAGFLILFVAMVALISVKAWPKVRKAWSGREQREEKIMAPVEPPAESEVKRADLDYGILEASASGEQRARWSEADRPKNEKRDENERLGIVFSVDGVDDGNVELFAKIHRIAGLVVSAFMILFLYGAFSRHAPIDKFIRGITYDITVRSYLYYSILFTVSGFCIYIRFYIGAFFISSVILITTALRKILKLLFRAI